MIILLATLLLTVPGVGAGVHQLEALSHRRPLLPLRPVTRACAPLAPRFDSTVTREVYGYMPYWANQNYLHFDLLTTIGLFDVTLEPDGRISNYSGFPQVFAATIERAHRNGVRCEIVATCFGWWNIHQAITVGADSAIRNLVTLAETTGMDGINMDFEEILGADRDTMVRFMQRLSAECRARGLTLTMATMPLDFLNAYDFAALADTTDGLFIMEYNFHWPGCPEAGPVAPLSGWEYYGNLQMSLNEYLGEIGDGRKLLFGLPYYGYDWPTLSDTVRARTSGIGADLYYANARPGAQAHGRRWNAEGQVPWYCYDSSGWRQGWYDDDSSLCLKYQEVHDHDLLGAGMWALGYDGARTELWAALRESFNRPRAEPANGDCETWLRDTFTVPSDTSLRPSNWYAGRRASVRREANVTHGGDYALKHLPNSLGDAWPVPSMVFQDVEVSPGTVYEFGAWARKREARGNVMKLALQWFGADHRIIREDTSPVLVGDTINWVRLSTGSVAAPTSAVFARLALQVLGYGGHDLWDDVSFGPVTGIAAGPASGLSSLVGPSVVRGVLWLGERHDLNVRHSGSWPRPMLFDASGRRVLDLQPGPNDVSRLAPGVYFVREQPQAASRRPQAFRKVVVTR
jgi:hypothetical protein